LLDDNEAHLEAMDSLIAGRGYSVISHARPETLLAADLFTSPACAIIDLRLGSHCGLDVASTLRERYPYLPISILTAFGDVPSAVQAIKSGLSDYIEKPFDNHRLLDTASGMSEQSCIRHALYSEYLEIKRRYLTLTAREADVFSQLVAGHTSASAAMELDLSSRTIEQHRSRLMKKMNVTSVHEAIRFNRILSEFGRA
jgi:FixJ family two-component response regulator